MQEMAETVYDAGASEKGRGSLIIELSKNLTGRKVFLLIGPDTIFILMENVFAIRAGYYIY